MSTDRVIITCMHIQALRRAAHPPLPRVLQTGHSA